MITRKSGSLPAEQCASVTASHFSTQQDAVECYDGCRCTFSVSVCECVFITTSQTDETCGVETSLWCNQQLPQRYNMQLIGVKDKKKSWWASLLSRHDLL